MTYRRPHWAYCPVKRTHPNSDCNYIPEEQSRISDNHTPKQPFLEVENFPCTEHINSLYGSSMNGKINRQSFDCGEPGCDAVLFSPAEYERHYQSIHIHKCTQCGRTVPSERMLDLHLTEMHDPFFALRDQRLPKYRCFVEGCTQLFSKDIDRQHHLVDVHMYSHDRTSHS
eukprot:CFRG6012T1